MGNRVFRESISAALVLSSVTAAAAEAGWATYQGNPAHTGFVDASITRNQPSLLWKTTVSSHPLVGLAVGGGTVFVSNTDNFTGLDSSHALDQQTGNILWSKAYSNNDTVSAPAYANGVVYFQTDGHSS